MRRRRAFTLVEIMIVVMIIGIILMIAVPSWMRIREKTQITSCMENLRVINEAKAHWGMENNMGSNDTPTEADLAPVYLKKYPKCPGSGTYTIGDISTEASCSVHGTRSVPIGTP
ncbi:MAG: prepilin-type N-terminal cleavage/methylation domain-containing protein [Armatimonadetes bacterium]|nr:prepilin-type N-terminal cleavage/methylation domain-containing protein [Armatimonadota bacterium]MBS1710249.1 prepilin-type N-terminal cleavage/methylation domain-containing protein [Armatimonadota bacterium]MBX3109114.1 prepilin-type N-terminal cleavage/methylation domain-containing protein [Fimbriimonadaceae bacterium]